MTTVYKGIAAMGTMEHGDQPPEKTETSSSKKRRLRRKKSHQAKSCDNIVNSDASNFSCNQQSSSSVNTPESSNLLSNNTESTMSSKDAPQKSREEVLAAREAKKLAKQKGKVASDATIKQDKDPKSVTTPDKKDNVQPAKVSPAKKEGNDEVDRVHIEDKKDLSAAKSVEQIKAEREAKKLAKQAKKKGQGDVNAPNTEKTVTFTKAPSESAEHKVISKKVVADTISNIVDITKDVQDITAKPEDQGKSKAELKAERRAKQEAQRAAKAGQQTGKPKPDTAPVQTIAKPTATTVASKDKEVSPKPKTLDKVKSKSQLVQRLHWFQHLHKELEVDPLSKIPLNSNLHPAIIKLGVQLATRVVTGSNARCIALLDALKKMVSDYTLPAKTEFGRGLESHLAASLKFLDATRAPSASQVNAVKYFRYHLTRLPNNVTEFEAKKILQRELEVYAREQIDTAGKAISLAVRDKISHGDNILTYGYSSLIERILREAHEAGVTFRAVIVGCAARRGGREMRRRLARTGLPCTYVDISALTYIMRTVDKVLLGADSLLGNGSVLGAAGTALVALAARPRAPVLVCCETHKFSTRVQTDAFVFNELDNPDDLIDKEDEDSPLRDWRSNPYLTPLNLAYDVTPASLVTAVVTELAILPCTSAPVVLRYKLSEYGV